MIFGERAICPFPIVFWEWLAADVEADVADGLSVGNGEWKVKFVGWVERSGTQHISILETRFFEQYLRQHRDLRNLVF